MRRVDGAKHCGVGVDYFDKMLDRQVLPQPRLFGDGVKLWMRQELDDALFALPSDQEGAANPVDRFFD